MAIEANSRGSAMKATRLTIIMPVYNDWTSATKLIAELELVLNEMNVDVDILAVDDCSPQPMPGRLDAGGVIRRVRVLRLLGNVGHQRAIAIGLVHVVDEGQTDLIAVMDSDGEDRPVELRRLIEEAQAAPGEIIVAKRQRRSETRFFRFFYSVYVLLFRLLTGYKIRFGNFSLMSYAEAARIANSPQVWNNYTASLIHSRLPLRYVPTTRGKRYAGRSTMNFVSLVTHGLGAISVFSETVFVRILISSSLLFLLSVLAASVALVLRLFTPLAIPGWATQVLGFSLIMSVQALITPIMVAFLMLNNRASVQPLPRSVAPLMIDEEHDLFNADVFAAGAAINRPTVSS
jgi:glycosyltransferase involved in cell wall biosynthesis